MKIYEKTYEDMFTSPKTLKKCDIGRVTVNGEDDIDKYINKFSDTLKEFQLSVFDYLVKIMWLIRKFCYCGYNRKKMNSNGLMIDSAFSVFMKRYIGFDNRLITRTQHFSAVVNYFDDFFPDFDGGNPFEVKYEYPFKYMNLECLIFVRRMSERLELLKIGEERKMSMNQFFDYVINYILCYNEEHGEKYFFTPKHTECLYITTNKYEEIETNNVHSERQQCD